MAAITTYEYAIWQDMTRPPTPYESHHNQDNGLTELDEYLDRWYADTPTTCRHGRTTVWCAQYGWLDREVE